MILFHLNKQVYTINFNELILRDSEILQMISTLKGIPKNMTIYELINIRKMIPNIVKNWINLLNNEQFLYDYKYGKISNDIYNDLHKSIRFLRIVPCEINTMKQLKYCFIFNPSSILLKNKIHLATISTYIHSWINPNQLKLHVFLMNSKNEIYEHFYINLYNKTIQNDLKYSNIKLKYRQVIWDISSMIKNLQYSKYHLIHSIIMTLVTNNHDDQSNNNVDDIHLNYIDLSNQLLSKPSSTSTTTIEDEPMENQDELKQILPNKHFNEDNDNDLEFTNNDNNNFNEKLNEQFESLFRKKNLLKINKNNKNNNHHNHNIIDNILSYNTQIILNMKTLNILQLENQYLIKKRLIHRSFLIESNKLINHYNIQSCPSFLDHNKRETKCCLFRYTLNKMQMDQNDKLRFIIFPHHLPINMCHGRCIGLYMPTDNAHSILMNRYFSGLGSVEREAIYNSMPCCAANETIPFTILYKDHKDQLVTETLPKAVKTNCACS